MAEYIKTLKEDNGDITYPVTQAGAVLLSGGGDLETTLNAKATQTSVNGKIDIGDVQSSDIVANAVTTAKIADGNVTTAKIADEAVTAAKLAPGVVTMTRTILFTGDTNDNITLSSAWSNFDQVEVYFYSASSGGGSADRMMILPGTCSNFTLEHNNAGGSNTLYSNYGRYAVSGATLTRSANHYQKNIAASAVATNNYNYVRVTKVVGIKFVSN